MTFYVNPSWTCTLFRNNKQHVVLGQKRKCQCMEESGLWRIQRERNRSAVSSKWNKCRISVGTNWRKCYASKLALKWQRFCLIGKLSMFFPSFLNCFSYFMDLWWCLWLFSVDIISSPDPKGQVSYCHHWASVVCRPSINFSHFNQLLWSHWANLNQTLVEWSLDGPLPNLCTVIPTSNQDGRQAKNRKKGEWNFNCPLLL